MYYYTQVTPNTSQYTSEKLIKIQDLLKSPAVSLLQRETTIVHALVYKHLNILALGEEAVQNCF